MDEPVIFPDELVRDIKRKDECTCVDASVKDIHIGALFTLFQPIITRG